MRSLIPTVIALSCCLGAATAEGPDVPSPKVDIEALFRELADGLPKDSQGAASARLELEYWHRDRWKSLIPPVRKSVTTKDGTEAEVVFLYVPAMSMPGCDFSMALVIKESRVIDWASCWTYNRSAKQELLLEDVDGDGFSDVAFRATEGFWGLLDKRQDRAAGDERTWLYAYAITAEGFESLFPISERELTFKLSYDPAGQPVELRVEGLPESFRERQMVECRLSVTNTSQRDLAIQPGGWFEADIDGMFLMTYGPPDKRTVLKAGETVSERIRFCVDGVEEEVAMGWKFVPKR